MPCTLNAIIANGQFTIENSAGAVVETNQPVWTPALPVVDGNGSLYPALFGGATVNDVLSLSADLGADFEGVSVHLIGAIAGQVCFQSDSSLGATGAWTPNVHSALAFNVLGYLSGDVDWFVQADVGGNAPFVATSRLELFWIYGAPLPLVGPSSSVSVLRQIFQNIEIDGQLVDVVNQVTELCYFHFNKTYDTTNGAAHFGPTNTGGEFDLSDYLSVGQTEIVNCYDQAGILQVLLGNLGIASQWQFMQPFGFINTTDLIGVGQCNNPFYAGNGTAPVVGENFATRTNFGNHAFIGYGNVTFDACAGPYWGEGNLAAYINAVVDTQTLLANNNNTGTAADVTAYPGISSTSFAAAVSEELELPSGMSAILGNVDAVRSVLPDLSTTVDWNKLVEWLCQRYGLKVIRRTLMPASDGVFSRWTIASSEAQGVIRVFKAQTSRVAFAREVAHLHSYQKPPATILTRDSSLGPAGLGTRDEQLAMFVNHSFFVLVSGRLSQARAIAHDIYTAIGSAPHNSNQFTVTHAADVMRAGQRKTIASSKALHDLVGPAVQLAARRVNELDVAARQIGVSHLRFVQIDEQTLDMDMHVLRIDVKP